MRIARPIDIIRETSGISSALRWSQVNLAGRRLRNLDYTHEIGKPREIAFASHDDSESAQSWTNKNDAMPVERNLLAPAGVTPSFEHDSAGWVELDIPGGTLSNRATIDSLNGRRTVTRSPIWHADGDYAGRIVGKTRTTGQATGLATDVRNHPIKLIDNHRYSWRFEVSAQVAPMLGGTSLQVDAWVRYWNDDFTAYVDGRQNTQILPFDNQFDLFMAMDGEQAGYSAADAQPHPGFTNAQIIVVFDSWLTTIIGPGGSGSPNERIRVPAGTPYDIFIDAAMVVEALLLAADVYWDDLPPDPPQALPASFFRDPMGFVWLRGHVASQYGSGLERDQVIFTLPEGYRPPYEALFVSTPSTFQSLGPSNSTFTANTTEGSRILDASPSTGSGGASADTTVGMVLRSLPPNADALPGQLFAISAPDHDHLLMNAAANRTVAGVSIVAGFAFGAEAPALIRVKPTGEVICEQISQGAVGDLTLDGINFHAPQPVP